VDGRLLIARERTERQSLARDGCEAVGSAVAALLVLAGVVLAPAMVAGTATRNGMTIIIDRTPRSIEVFMALPADAVEAVFGALPGGIVDAAGEVDVTQLRLGSWEQAAALIDHVAVAVDGNDGEFEAMSLMLHPGASPLPFAAPWDGLVATSVCTATLPATPTSLADHRLYGGYIAHPIDGFAQVELRFPQTGRVDLDVQIREHVNGVPLRTRRASLPDGGVLSLRREVPNG
jgi:hypothetical protein